MIWAATVPKPGPTEAMILRLVGTALLWPGSSEHWRAVFGWLGKHPDHPIAKTMRRAVADQVDGDRLRECLTLGADAQQINEPRWLTRGFAEADGGNVEAGVQMRLEKRRRAAQQRAAVKQHGAIG